MYQKGRGAQINTDNRFSQFNYDAEGIDGLDEPLDIKPLTQFFIETPKKILNKVVSEDLPMAYSLNPYQGCEHGCIYCYARNTHEYWGFSAGTDFENKIMVKKNAPELLEKAFLSKNWKAEVVSLSGNTDCYQPAEKKFGITRQLLALFLKYRNPVSIITKNALVLRDIDIITELAKLGLVHVYVSITTLDNDLRSAMEPRTVTATQRLKVVQQLTSAGVPVGVMSAPIIPGLNDHEIPSIIQAAATAGALTVGYTMVRLNGPIGEIFEDWIVKNMPDRAEKVLSQIRDSHGGQLNDSRVGVRMRGEGIWAQTIRDVHLLARKKYLKDRKMPAYDFSLFTRPGQLTLFS
jgi:DNA repair photolyase